MAVPYETHTYMYAAIAATAILLGFYIIFKDSIKKKLDKKTTIIMFIVSLLMGFFGANFFYHFIPWTHAKSWSGFSLIEAIKGMIYFKGGLVWYGGLIFAILTIIVFCRIRKLPTWKYLDSSLLGIIFGLFIARLGCFFAGCCRGLESGLPWAVERFGTTIHPTQLYMSLNALLVFVILYEINRKRKFDGYVFLWAMVLYPSTRFVIEFMRVYHTRILGILTASQVISLMLLCISVPILIIKYKKFK